MTFGEVPFSLPSEKIRELIDRYQPAEHRQEVLAPYPSPNPRLNHLGVPTQPFISPRLNDLFYPTGGTRWAWFRGLMTRADLATVESLAFADDTATALPFLLDAEGVSITTDLYLLPARPVCELGEQYTDLDGLFLVTLVDERFFWQSRGAGKIRCKDATATWAGLISTVAALLDVTISHASVDAVYGVPEPDSALYSSEESPAAILDAIAHNLGCVLVREFDSTYYLQRWDAANILALADGVGNLAVTRTAGGSILPFDPAASSAKRAAILPSKITATFPRWVTDTGYEVPDPLYRGWELHSYHDVFRVEINAADLSGAYATLPTYDAEAVLRCTAKALLAASGDTTPTNEADLADLAEQLAYDFYDRNLGSADVSYPGVKSVKPKWGCDFLFAWTGAGKPYTRLTRPAWNLQPQEFQHGLEAIEVPATTRNGWFARLTTDSSGKWKWVALTLDSSGVYVDDGSESADFNAVPLTIDGVNFSTAPFTKMRVWMIRSKTLDSDDEPQYEFLPIGNNPTDEFAIGPGWVVGLLDTDCLFLSVLGVHGTCDSIDTTQLIKLEWDIGSSRWVSADDFNYVGGSGPVNFWLDSGRVRASIDGVDLFFDSAGVLDTGNYIDFTGGGNLLCPLGSGVSPPTCEDNYFKVRFRCGSCDPPLVECCSEERPEGLATTLYASLSLGLGTVPMVWNGTYWIATPVSVILSGCGVRMLYLRYTTGCKLQYSCDNIHWGNATGGGTIDCGPPYTDGTYSILIPAGVAKLNGCDCPGGTGATITADVSE